MSHTINVKKIHSCGHWWRKKREFLGHRGCYQCLNSVEFRCELAMEHQIKGAIDLFGEFLKLPKEVQDKVLENMDLRSINPQPSSKSGIDER